MDEKYLINEQIKCKNVLLINNEGKQIGVISIEEAIKISEEQGFDLVQLNSNEPPTCKLLDYGKMVFEQKKKNKKKNQQILETKEIRLTLSTDIHDQETKAKQIEKFLQKKNQVKISILLRGREISRPEYGKVALENFLKLLKEKNIIFKLKQDILINGRNIDCIIIGENK